MAKSRELCESERAAIYHLRIAGHSFAEIAKQVGCTKSTAYRIMQKHEKTGSLLRSKKSGRPKVISRRGERIVKRIFKTSRFAKFNEIKDEIDKSFPSDNLSKSTVVIRKHCAHRPFLTQHQFSSFHSFTFTTSHTWDMTTRHSCHHTPGHSSSVVLYAIITP